MTTPRPKPDATDAGNVVGPLPDRVTEPTVQHATRHNPGRGDDIDMTAPREDDKDAALRSTRASLDRLALDRLEFEIRAWWSRNRHLHDQVLLERDGRRDERGLKVPGRRLADLSRPG